MTSDQLKECIYFNLSLDSLGSSSQKQKYMHALQDTPSQTVLACQRRFAYAPEWCACRTLHPAGRRQSCHTLLFSPHGRRQQRTHIPEMPAGSEQG